MTDSITHAVPAVFATTRWSLVLRSKGGSEPAKVALAELCGAYWGPVHGFVQRRCRNEERAKDLTQEFFARLLASNGVEGADPARGRFRSFLLGAVRHFLSDQADREGAAKRGAGKEHVSLDEFPTETGPPAMESGSRAERGFDRAWAVSVVNRALAGLEAEQAREGRAEVYAILKAWLPGEAADTSQASAAERLGWTENAVRVAVHRLRRRFRDLIREEIAQTVAGPAEVQDELRYLLEVLVDAG